MNTTNTPPHGLIEPMCAEIGLRADGDLDFHKFGEIMAFAAFCERAQYLPKGCTRDQAVLAIVAGRQLGMAPFAAIQNIAVINGRPSVWGDAVGALVAASGLCEREYSEEVGAEKEFKIVFHVKRRGREDEVVREFGYSDAVRAGLWGKQGPWTSYPKRMMMMRARAFAYRDAFPDVLKGMRIMEEEQDGVIDVTDQAVVTKPAYANSPRTAGGKPSRVRDGNLMKVAAGGSIGEEPVQEMAEASAKTGGDGADE